MLIYCFDEKYFSLLSQLKIVVLLNIFMETKIHFFQDSLMKVQENSIYLTYLFFVTMSLV